MTRVPIYECPGCGYCNTEAVTCPLCGGSLAFAHYVNEVGRVVDGGGSA